MTDKNTGLDDVEIHMPCPACGHKTAKQIKWLTQNTEYRCEGCRETVTYDPADLDDLKGLSETIKGGLFGR